MRNQTALIVGGSSGLGRATAEYFAKQGFSLALISRDQEDLEALRSSLQTVYGVQVFCQSADLLSSVLDADALIQDVVSKLGTIDYAFLVAGGSFEGDEKVPTTLAFKNCLRLNFESIALIMNAVLAKQAVNKCRSILVISSIAAVVPRSQNSTYAAAKMALENYAISLRHYSFQSGVPTNIQVVRMGYMESGFTRGKKLLFPVAAPATVARFIFENRDRDYGLKVFPWFWVFILFVLRCLPWHIYKKLRF